MTKSWGWDGSDFAPRKERSIQFASSLYRGNISAINDDFLHIQIELARNK